jgi:hypothetical protein
MYVETFWLQLLATVVAAKIENKFLWGIELNPGKKNW